MSRSKSTEPSTPLITFDEFSALVSREMEWGLALTGGPMVEGRVWRRGDVELATREGARPGVRPGGTVGGPVLFQMVDTALYAAVLSQVGMVPLAVTTDLTMHFLNRPVGDRQLYTRATLIKVGKRLLVGECFVTQDDVVVAKGTGSYILPPPSKSKL